MWEAFANLFREGGPILYPIFGVSILAFYIGLGKGELFARVTAARRAFLAQLAAPQGVPTAKTGYKSFDRLVLRMRSQSSCRMRQTAFNEFTNSLLPRLNRGLSTMVACAVITPLLGLLGTISGMNEMFSVIGQFGFGSPTILSHGISVALKATLTGLGVAVCVIFFQNYLNNKKAKLVDSILRDQKELCGAEAKQQDTEEKGDFMHADYRLVPEENERPDINLAPFVDTIMILLIFFVVTANLYVETGVDVSKPKAASSKPVSSKALLVGVTREGTIHMYGRQTTLERLRMMLEQEAAKQPDISVVIIADREAAVGRAVEVMDQCGLAGVSRVSIAAGKE